MKIFPNIPGFAKLVYCLKYFNPYRKKIEAAKAAGDFEEERAQILAATSSWGPMIMDMFGSEVLVEGLENLPEKGPVVLVGNHQGYADIAAYFAAFKKFQFAFVAKRELAQIPLYGKWMPRIRSVFIERDDPRASLEAIKEGVALIEQGFSLVIFPEGTRSKGPVPGPFMKGSLKLATKPGVPIVPVSMNGTYKMYEQIGVIRPATIRIIVHEPIPTAGLSRQEEKALNERVEQIVKDGVRQLALRDGDIAEDITEDRTE
ncbi:MAG: 1-acyl-sn-glycerol-3-phosphate acyltransferase [Firmicutes bacterium]|nr:1-acyl-sn-glycerol-3-phosphate acyltransferase [Bacillota bacterium]